MPEKKSNNPFSLQEGRVKNGKLKDFSYRKNWTEDSYISESEAPEKIGKSFDIEKTKYIGILVTFFVFMLLSRVAWLQVVKGDYYYSVAEGNRIRIQRIEAKRGVIYDRNLNPLVRNQANFMIYFVPVDLPDSDEEKNGIIRKICDIVGNLNFDEIVSQVDAVKKGTLDSYQPLFIADNIPYEKAMMLYLETENMPGVNLTNKTRREYNLYASSLSHILGYTGKISPNELKNFGNEYLQIDYIGKTGVEYFWENELKGKNGKKHVEVDALGNEKKIMNTVEAEDGHNLVLSIDINMQKKLEDLIAAELSKLKLSRASAIVMDPNNGEILSLVSFPAYDNNVFARGITQVEYSALANHPDRPLFNRAVSGEFPSGSTIKPVMSAAALEEGVITEKTSFNSVGGIRIGEWYFPDWRSGGHGITDVRKAIAQSVNTFFYYIGGGYDDFIGLGVERIGKYFRLFGLGSQTGIDLAGEVDGFVPTKEWKEEAKGEKWYIGDTYHLAIGQGDLLVTPLQVANYTTFFANKGKMYRPHLIKTILSAKDKFLGNVESVPVRENFIKDYNVEVVRQGMRETVLSGSARSLNTLSVTSAGKTGTAQWSSKKNTHAWYTGFAPYENPEFVITILIEEGGEGSSVCVPITKEFMQWYFDEYKKKKQ